MENNEEKFLRAIARAFYNALYAVREAFDAARALCAAVCAAAALLREKNGRAIIRSVKALARDITRRALDAADGFANGRE